MNIQNLPDDVLVHIFYRYLNLKDLINVAKTCTRFHDLIETFDLWKKFLVKYPIIDLNFPYGYNEHFRFSKAYEKTYTSRYKLEKYLNLIDNKLSIKVFYSYGEKMLPSIQIDDESNESSDFTSILLTDANKIICLNLDEIHNYKPSYFQMNQLKNQTKTHYSYFKSNKFNSTFKNNIKINNTFEIFDYNDIISFKKKNDVLVCFSENSIKVNSLSNRTKNELILTNEIYDSGIKIKCIDFTTKLNKLVYGCSNGFLKIYDLKSDNEENESKPFDFVTLNDRILRCCFSPSFKNLAIGTAGLNTHQGHKAYPLRIYDFEKLKEIQTLKSKSHLKIGDGVLALSFIDENLVMSAGYDTFIRIFDLRSNKCIQSLEEPEDMSIYTVCCSKYYGLLSGNDRQSIIRYWDRRVNKVISTFLASNFNSSVYSLACTPDTIFACWDHGVSCIDFR